MACLQRKSFALVLFSALGSEFPQNGPTLKFDKGSCSLPRAVSTSFFKHRRISRMMDIPSDDDSYQEEVVSGGTYPPNSRVAKLEEEAFLDSLKQFKHVQPRIGKF
jgi:hypothetical protein